MSQRNEMMNNKEKIKVTIVVPVYNVEKYIDKCLLSLINQTYRNIEIILVDDGSTDSSGSICDDYASRYHNIIALHKKNGGLSSARNYAMRYITGDFVTFVDSDDYVEIYYIENMIHAIENNPLGTAIDMVICHHVNESPEGKSLGKGFARQHEPEYMTGVTALEAMCYGRKFGASACEKLITTNIAKGFPFPDGKIYEDLYTMFHMIAASKNIVFLGIPMYHYVQRQGSIRHSSWTPAVMDLIYAAQELLNYIDLHFPSIHSAGAYRYFIAANEFYLRAFQENNYTEIIEPIRRTLKPLWRDIITNKAVNTMQKMRFWMLIYIPQSYRILYQLYRKIKWS